MILHVLDILGTLAFAVSGAFRAVKYELDLLGVLVLAVATGIGGGITRDVLLGSTPPASLQNGLYLGLCIAGGLLVFWAAPRVAQRWDMVLFADAVGLGVFSALGAATAERLGATSFTIVLMAALTACGGGVIRDLLVREIPAVLTSDFYATPALLGGALFVALGELGIRGDWRLGLVIGVTWALRTVAMYLKVNLPKVSKLPESPSQMAQGRHQEG